MAAGQGFKTFVTGEVLTSGDVNGYLMQGINVFADATARDAAILTPAEGQFAFTKDNNSLWYYDGAAWVASGATGDIEGVTAGVGISGGGTSGTVTITNSMATAIDAKGDLVAGTAADTFDRLAVGANDTVLTADSSTATGLKWAAPGGAGANYSLLNAGGTSLTGSTVTISGISGVDKLIVLVNAGSSTGSSDFAIHLNGDTANNYGQWGLNISPQNSTTTYNPTNIGGIFEGQKDNPNSLNIGNWPFAAPAAAAGTVGLFMRIEGCNSSGVKMMQQFSGANTSGVGPQNLLRITGGIYVGTSTISSVTISCGASPTFDAGTIFVYGSA